MHRVLILAAFSGVLTSFARADVVLLRNGGRLEGATSEEGDRLVIRMETGTARIPRGSVLRVVKRVAPADDYAARAAAVTKGDAKGHWELARWCAEAGLRHGERVELEATLAADPQHAEARKKLGYEKVEGQWLCGAAFFAARGMVKVDGAWATQAKAAEVERRRLAQREAALAAAAEAEARESAHVRAASFAASVPRGYRPTRRYRDDRRGFRRNARATYGYRLRRRHAPGYLLGIGGYGFEFGPFGFSLPYASGAGWGLGGRGWGFRGGIACPR
ncbi:MAG: hypothetical protein FD180_11 [Planctomycetota bacterium]|nr:MAG: hypothetical protein FD180_11 [Planctomycetota bacterium]